MVKASRTAESRLTSKAHRHDREHGEGHRLNRALRPAGCDRPGSAASSCATSPHRDRPRTTCSKRQRLRRRWRCKNKRNAADHRIDVSRRYHHADQRGEDDKRHHRAASAVRNNHAALQGSAPQDWGHGARHHSPPEAAEVRRAVSLCIDIVTQSLVYLFLHSPGIRTAALDLRQDLELMERRRRGQRPFQRRCTRTPRIIRSSAPCGKTRRTSR